MNSTTASAAPITCKISKKTQKSGSEKKKKRSYTLVPLEQRRALLDLVFSSEHSVRSTALQLGIKYTTARHIISVYKKTGQVESLSVVKARERQIARAQKDFNELLAMFSIQNAASASNLGNGYA